MYLPIFSLNKIYIISEELLGYVQQRDENINPNANEIHTTRMKGMLCLFMTGTSKTG
jgi:hypothetical protein